MSEVSEVDIARFPLFSGLNAQDTEALRQSVHTHRFAAGVRIFEEGEPARGFYLVTRGAVKIFKLSPAGQEQVLSVVLPGQTFAEAAVFQGMRYPASAESLHDSEMLFIEREAFVSQLRRDPELALRMLAGLSMKLRRMVHLVEDLTLRDARGRICRYLVGLIAADARGEAVVKLPVQQVLVARLLGITSETLSRTLKTLKDEGILDTEGRGRLTIHDVERLREAAGEVTV